MDHVMTTGIAAERLERHFDVPLMLYQICLQEMETLGVEAL